VDCVEAEAVYDAGREVCVRFILDRAVVFVGGQAVLTWAQRLGLVAGLREHRAV